MYMCILLRKSIQTLVKKTVKRTLFVDYDNGVLQLGKEIEVKQGKVGIIAKEQGGVRDEELLRPQGNSFLNGPKQILAEGRPR